MKAFSDKTTEARFSNDFLNDVRYMYHNLFGRIPNEMCIDFEVEDKMRDESKEAMTKIAEMIIEKYEVDSGHHFVRHDVKDSSKTYFIVVEDGLCIAMDASRINILYDKETKTMEDIIRLIDENKVDEDNYGKVNLVAYSKWNGFYLESFNLNKFEINLDENYNDDFKEIHEMIVTELKRENNTGLVLLHGSPGTGKTYYIRHLSRLLDKKLIYIPPNVVNQLTSEEFVPFLLEHPDSVLIIEDAENVIHEREGGNNQAVSNLLNLSAGLLGDALKILAVCTFNKNVGAIDSALVRKGRLVARYEFESLETEKTNRLLKKLGFDYVTDEPMNLADIYNFDKKEFGKGGRRKIKGFEI